MNRFAVPWSSRRARAALLVLASLVLSLAAAFAATRPTVENPHGKFHENCQLCHNAQAWNQIKVSPRFDHGKFGFPLTGAHATSDCMSCHTSLDFSQSKTQCASCHQDPHRGEMGTDCARCHGSRSFIDRGPMVRAHQLTRFPLTGSHASLDCESCHPAAAQGKLQFVATNLECYGCHKAQYAAAPNHVSGNYSTECQTCHTPIQWNDTNGFDHAAVGFPLTGQHALSVRKCDDCHHGQFVHTSSDCYSCHANSNPGYANATPPHDPVGFPTNTGSCIGCHVQANATHQSWSGAGSFDHAAAGFPLNGQHSTSVRQCNDCHAASGYAAGATSKECISCHQNSTPGYANATPPHNPTYFPTTTAQCTTCHAGATSYTTWANGTYRHVTMQLTNAHANRACEDCHHGNYTTLAFSCYNCHQAAYAGATPVKHTPANFPTANSNCQSCHNTVAFSPSTWPANHSTTAFAANYTGAHPALTCTDCHNTATWNVNGTGNNCYGCHATDYANTTNPHHDTTNYPTTGCTCHTTTAWAPATGFDHTAAGFPLTGNHSLTARQCADCHAASGYNPGATSPDCYACHANSNLGVPGYTDNAVVKHSTPNFPTTTPQCIACHSAANANHLTWSGGTFSNHAGVTTNFALSGNHAGFQCSDCHTAPTTDLKQYTCSVACHNGDSRFTRHGNESCAGTTFNTAKADPAIKACYSCHPRGTSSSPC